MLMLKSTHEAIVAKKDAEIAGLMKRIETLHGCQKAAAFGEDAMLTTILDLRRELAVFTAPRARNAKGHFLPTKGAEA